MMAVFLILAMVAVATGYVYGNHLFRSVFSREDVPSRAPPPGAPVVSDPPAAGDDGGIEDPAGDAPDGGVGDDTDPDEPATDPDDPATSEPDDPDPDPPPEPGAGDPPATPVTSQVAVEELRLYRVQVGAFREPGPAEAQAQSIRGLQRPAYVTGAGSDGWYRVWVMVSDSADAAAEYAAPLSALDVDTWVFAVPPVGDGDGSVGLEITAGSQEQFDKFVASLQELLDFVQRQGGFWSRFALGAPGTPPGFGLATPALSTDADHRELAELMAAARAQSDRLQQLAGDGFPAGCDLELLPAYMELVDRLLELLLGLR